MTPGHVMVGTARFRLVVITMVITVAASIVGALFAPGWVLPTAVNILVDGAFIAFIWIRRDSILGRLFLMGIVAATIELLISDPTFVQRHVLVYMPGGPFVVDSPLYMPMSWIFLIVQIGSLSRWCIEKWGLGTAVAIMGALGAINGPSYEYLAQYSKLWIYQDCWMIRGLPIFVIVSELLIGMSLPLAVVRLPGLTLPLTVLVGIVIGLWTWITGVVTFAVVGKIPGS